VKICANKILYKKSVVKNVVKKRCKKMWRGKKRKMPLPTFIINLERRKDRLEYIYSQYKDPNFSIEIVKAYDGTFPENNSDTMTKLRDEFLLSLDKVKRKGGQYKYYFLNAFTKGELGCFLSHLSLWKRMIDEDIEKAFIFEDDCIFSLNFSSILPQVLEELPKDFGICWLGGKVVANYRCDKNEVVSKNLSLKREEPPYGTFSYLIDKNYAQILYNYAMNEFRGNLGVDYFMDEFLMKNQHKEYLVSPFICHSSTDMNSIFKTDVH
jgi:GR25 family glycosyltransferase involved in LPS biosynthesis